MLQAVDDEAPEISAGRFHYVVPSCHMRDRARGYHPSRILHLCFGIPVGDRQAVFGLYAEKRRHAPYLIRLAVDNATRIHDAAWHAELRVFLRFVLDVHPAIKADCAERVDA